ncbi:ERB1 protein, partial [Spizella passerina]|nr:ERB1 protein [Spizella passerina]
KGRGHLLWNNRTAKALPTGVFLICGDRAWQGIPKNVYGGPCYLGKLTMFAPHLSQLRNPARRRPKRSLKLSPNCNDNVQLLSTAARVALAVFLPGGAAGKALVQLERLACWSAKQANVTTKVLGQLLVDQNSLRHALLQNRAAVDFLLLAQGHGCEDFEGMCCLNLSDHGESIHKSITWLKGHIDKIKKETSVFDEWLQNLFGTIPGWLSSLLGEGLRLFVIFIIILLCACIVF